MSKRIYLVVLSMFLLNVVNAQILNPVKWTFAAKKTGKNEAVLFLKATIDKGFHLYSQNIGEGGPLPTTFTFTPSKAYTVVGKTAEPKAISAFDKTFNMNLNYFDKEVVFQQKIKLTAGATTVKGLVEFMSCDDMQCTPPQEVEFAIQVK